MDNIPNMNHKQKKEEKKKGFLPWLRSKLGFGGKNAVGGAGQGGAGLGRTALGAGKFGPQGWLGGLFAGNAGMIASFAILGAMVAGFYYGTNSGAGSASPSAFNSNKGVSTYVPAVMRQGRSGSSLDIFKDANKGGLAEPGEEGGGYDQDGYDKDGYDKEGYDREGYDRDGFDRDGYSRDGYDRDGYDRNGYNSDGLDRNGARQGEGGEPGLMSKLASGFSNAFGSSSGGGGQAGEGPKRELTSQLNSKVGAGFKNLPKFNQRQKLMSMKGSARPVVTAKGVKTMAGRKGALGQSKAIRNSQLKATGSYDPDSMRSTQDQAWEGTTDPGKGVGGSGLNPGAGGSGPSPSNPGDSSGSSGSGSSGSSGSSSGSSGSSSGSSSGDPNPSPDPTPQDISPWAGLASAILKMVVLASVLAVAGAAIIAAAGWTGVGYYIGMAMCIAAAGLAIWAGVLAAKLISQYHQMALGALYLAGAGLALTGAVMAMFGNAAAPLTTMATWLAIAGGVCALMGMFVK